VILHISDGFTAYGKAAIECEAAIPQQFNALKVNDTPPRMRWPIRNRREGRQRSAVVGHVIVVSPHRPLPDTPHLRAYTRVPHTSL
jgi:hypothetical protein